MPGQQKYRFFAFGMGDELGVGMLIHQPDNTIDRKFLMDHAGAIPEEHIPPGDGVDVIAQVFIGCKNQRLVLGEALYDFHGVGRGADHIGHGFQVGRTIDVGDDLMAGVEGFEFREFRGRC